MKVSIQQLRYVVKTAETKSMTEAAKALSISQATLSEGVSQVEKELGFKLFRRTKQGVTPTPKGIEAIGYISRVLASMETFEEHYAKAPTKKKQRFSVSTQTINIVTASFNRVLNQNKQTPIDSRIAVLPFDKPVDDVITGASDIAVVALTAKNKQRVIEKVQKNGLEFTFLFKAPLFAFMHVAHPLAKSKSVTRAQLDAFPECSQEYLRLALSGNTKVFKGGDFDPEVSHMETQIPFVADVDGFFVWCNLYPERKPDADTAMVLIEPVEYFELGYVTAAGKQLSDIEQRFIEAVRGYGNLALSQTH